MKAPDYLTSTVRGTAVHLDREKYLMATLSPEEQKRLRLTPEGKAEVAAALQMFAEIVGLDNFDHITEITVRADNALTVEFVRRDDKPAGVLVKEARTAFVYWK